MIKETLSLELMECVYNNDSIKNIVNGFDEKGFYETMGLLKEKYAEEEIEDYFKKFIKINFTDKREMVCGNSFCKKMFDKKWIDISENKHSRNITKMIPRIINETLEEQKELFIQGNRKSMDLNEDIWVMYFIKGTTLCYRVYDFGKIKSQTLKKEVKMYFRNLFWNKRDFKNGSNFNVIVTAINEIKEEFPNVRYFADIEMKERNYIYKLLQTDKVKSRYGKKLSIETVRKIIQALSHITEYLMNIEEYKQKPIYNYFKDISFRNAKSMTENTMIIPEEVTKQIDIYYKKLNEDYQLLYEVISYTGMRIAEASHLKKDCITKIKDNDDYCILTYEVVKTTNSRKIKGISNKNTIAIPTFLADKIEKQIKKTEKLRKETETEYIFLQIENKSMRKVKLISEYNLSTEINKLIKKHNIVDINGELWKYENRQCRKTLAVKLAENGATSQEIANQLGHLDVSTTEKYYAEVRKMKLAELNSEFFKKEFEMYVGEENLKTYTEEERRSLYVDFSLNKREVEFGQCSKHISEGPCGVRTGQMNCATCPKLCTGIKYVDKWRDLENKQKEIVREMKSIYINEGIEEEEYSEYIEFKREKKLLKVYESVLENILKEV